MEASAANVIKSPSLNNPNRYLYTNLTGKILVRMNFTDSDKALTLPNSPPTGILNTALNDIYED